jgi:replicative DNA helicase
MSNNSISHKKYNDHSDNEYTGQSAPIYSGVEGALVAACIEHAVATRVSGLVSPHEFKNPILAQVFKCCLELESELSSTEYAGADLNALAAKLRYHNVLNAVGGINGLIAITDCYFVLSKCEEYARLIRAESQRSTLEVACRQALSLLKSGGDIQKVYLGLAGAINAREDSHNKSTHSLIDAVSAYFEELEQPPDTNPVVIGLAGIDRNMSGLRQGQLITVLGRPGMGKTAFAVTMLKANASKGKHGVFFTLEMTKTEIAARVLSAESRVNSQKMRARACTDEEFSRIVEAAQSVSLKTGTTTIVENDQTIESIIGEACRIHASIPVDYIVIDHLHHILQPSDMDRTTHLNKCVRELKSLAKRLCVPVVVFAQVKREVEAREDKRPRAGDGEWCGSIEQVSDVIIGLYREEYYEPKPANSGLARIEVLKQRDGATGPVVVRFEKEYTLFTEVQDAQEIKTQSATFGQYSKSQGQYSDDDDGDF